MTDRLLPCPVCGGDRGRYDFDPQGCACAPSPEKHLAPADDLRKRVMRAIVDPDAMEGFQS